MPFTFVDAGASDDRDSRRKIRKHLSVFNALQRRQRDFQKQKNAAELISTSVVAAGPLAWRLKDEDEDEEDRRNAERAHSTGRLKNSPNLSQKVRNLQIQNIAKVTSVPVDYPSNEPTSFMSAARKDPFSAYPIPADAVTDATVDFFVHDLGPYLYGYARNDYFDLFRHRGFPIASQDPAAFHANMLMASINLDIINGRSLPGMRALRHRVEAIRLVNEQLAVPTNHLSESTMYTIIVLTCLEHIWGAIGHNEVHGGGLEQVLIKCGGLKALRKYPLLEHTLYSICLVAPRVLSFGNLGLYSEEQSHHSPRDERRAMATELMELLQSTMSRSHSWPLSMLAFAFQPGSPLYETMMFPGYELSKHNTSHSSKAAERSHLSILFYFHCMLSRLPEQGDIVRLVSKLNTLIRDAWLWQNSPAMVQYLIVKADDSVGLEDVNLAWYVLRLVEICGLLSNKTYSNVKQYLFTLLSQSEKYPSLDLQAGCEGTEQPPTADLMLHPQEILKINGGALAAEYFKTSRSILFDFIRTILSQGPTTPGCSVLDFYFQIRHHDSEDMSRSGNERRVSPPDTNEALDKKNIVPSTLTTGVRPKSNIGGSLLGRNMHRWTSADQEKLREAGMRVASGQSTWKDEMINMPAGTRLLNCQERFGRFFKTTGSPKQKKAILRKNSAAAANSSLLRLPMLVRHRIWHLVKPEPVQFLADAKRLTHWWNGSIWVYIYPERYFDSIAAYPLLLVNKQVHKECLMYNKEYVSLGFYALPDLTNYVAAANERLLELVSSFRVCVSKVDSEGVDLNLALHQALIGIYETVNVVDENADEEQGGRGGVAVVGGLRPN